jgi:hypothetical protein
MSHTGSPLPTLSAIDLDRTCGGSDLHAPLSGDVTQQINTNWGGTQIINPPPQATPSLRFEYLRQHPEARFAAPPHKPMPIRR